MLRYEIMKEEVPPFESKKIDTYCNVFLKTINSPERFKKCINKIIKKIDSLNLDLTDNDLSKSNKLVKQCIKKYFVKK
jgi:hypothetical protein